MDSILKGKTVVVTGATRGIGLEIARQCAEKGASVAIPYVGADPSEAVAEIEKYGVKCKAYECNVADYNAVQTVCAQIVADFGGVDALVNNAGITADKLILRMTEEDFDKVIAVNLKGAFNMIKHLTPVFMKARQGAIVNISSVVGLMGNPGQINYSASKAGLIGITKTVAKELSSRNVTCNAVAPGFIDTAMTAVMTPEQQAFMQKNIPLGRVGTVTDVAKAVLFFLENRYITGEVVKVDGGMYI
ncbi:MAG: 3-oxoacyl-[acyl-carrier-protein] reductase [Clostridiales bacterium]|nr:3-oxoacyl-[acyl-carrier-protein] reductase [Clostridiales bacterium]